MSQIPRNLSASQIPNLLNPHDPGRMLHQLQVAMDVPLYGVTIIAGAENTGTNTVRFSFQVVDRQRRPIPGRFLVELWFATAAYGAPAAGLALTVVTGVTQQTVTANQHLKVVTSTAGLVEVDAVIAGAATRYPLAIVSPIETAVPGSWV